MSEISILINTKGNSIVIDSDCEWELGDCELYDFKADNKLDKKWSYLFDDIGSLEECELAKKLSTVFTIKFWEEQIPDIECGGYDYYYHITEIEKTKISYKKCEQD